MGNKSLKTTMGNGGGREETTGFLTFSDFVSIWRKGGRKPLKAFATNLIWVENGDKAHKDWLYFYTFSLI